MEWPLQSDQITVTPGHHVQLDYVADNAAFEGLENLVDGLQIDKVQRMVKEGNQEGSLYDTNGNKVGTWNILPSEALDAPKTLQDKLASSLDCTEAALDYIREIAKHYESPTLKSIDRLLAFAFDLIDDEQQIMVDKFEN